jgi:hypothetical protein
MSILASAILVLFAASSTAQDFSRKTLRESFYAASQDGEAARAFYDWLAAADTTAPLLLGYKGMANLMLAYHALNPYTKLKHFLQGKHLLNRAIALAPEQLELRYLRFTVQTNAPKFLGYSGDISEDKALILATLASGKPDWIDNDLRDRIVAYLSQSPYCSRQEKKQLKIMAE